MPKFGNTAFDNPVADALTFRDQNGSPVQYNTGELPDTTPYWSPRVGFNWDVDGDQTTQVRGGTGSSPGKPPYVWISNQIGNTGVLYGFLDDATTRHRLPVQPESGQVQAGARPAAPAASYELDVTDQSFRFPQTWRTNIGVDRRLPWGLIGTVDYIYNQDLNGRSTSTPTCRPPTGTYTGVDNRPLGDDRTRNGAAPGHHRRAPVRARRRQIGPCYRA